MSKHIDQKVAIWLTGNYDEATKNNIRDLQANQPGELEESFYKLMAEKTKQNEEFWRKACRKDFYMSAVMAVELGIIDQVI